MHLSPEPVTRRDPLVSACPPLTRPPPVSGQLHCFEYWRDTKQLRPEAIAVVIHARYYDPEDAAQRRLEGLGVLSWAPAGNDDDLFLLQLALDADAWLISNDQYENHRDVSARLKNRRIPYMWAGFGAKTVFTPSADKCAAFERSRATRSN